MSANRLKFIPTEGRCLRGYRQIKGEDRLCRGVDLRNMIYQLQTDYLDRYEGVWAAVHQVSRFDESSAVYITHLGKVKMSRQDGLRHKTSFHLQISPQQ